jgi:hypothetical protein
VNKTIHYEATSLFYSQNRFDLNGKSVEQIARFFGQIGQNNTDYIRHIRIGFPEFYIDPESGIVALQYDSVGIISEIQSGCTNLRTLMISLQFIHDGRPIWLTIAPMEDFEDIVGNLELVNIRLTAIPSLQEIIVEMQKNGANNDIRREMESNGWKIRIIDNKEDNGFRTGVWYWWDF